eukprot:XP_011673012.1 PREDICTED: synaptic vesicle 2-related protein isoform X1 [Strongylocentrotus purpuratus]
MASLFDESTFTDTDVIIKDGDDVIFKEETLAEVEPQPYLNTSEDSNGTGTKDHEYTVQEAVDAMGFGWFQVKISFIVGFNWMADAFEIMLLSVLSDKLRCEWDLYPYQQALLTTFVFTGYFIGAPLWGMMGDKFGRKKTLALCSFHIFYFGFLSSFSPNLIWLLILRGLLGASLGGTSQSVIICAEFLPSKSRGLCLVCLEAFWVIGVCLEITLAMVVMPTLGWRYLLIFSSFPLVIFVVLVTFLPESASYQQASGNWSGAMATLEDISRTNKKPLPPGKLKRNAELKPKGSIRELFSTKLLAMTTVILINLWFCNAFLYYGNVLLSAELFSSGVTSCVSTGNNSTTELECFSACKSLDTQGYVGLLVSSLGEIPGILLTLFMIDTAGRKLTMGLEMLVCAVFSFLLLMCVDGIPQMIFIFVIRGMISGAFQALFVYTPEVFPTNVRSVGLGWCVAFSKLGSIVTPFVAQVLIKQSVFMTFCVYGGCAVFASLLAFILPTETKGRTLK